MADNKDLITAQNLADSLNLSVETIWRYTREKKIPYVELGNKQYRYRLLDVINSLSSSTVQENPAQYGTDTDKKLTYQDYLELPEEPGYSFALLEGVLIKEPSPNVIHQRVSRRLQRILEDYFWQVDPKGEVFDAPLDVTFHDITVVQPDLLYIAGEQSSIIKDTRIDGPPKLVVEVLSPSTSRKDRMKKLGIYQRAFVEHYWLVNPNDKTLECFALRDGTYSLVACGMEEAIVEHPDFSGLALKLQELWK